MTSRNNASKTPGRPFERGNPGRPKGARHKTTLLAEKLMQADAATIVQAVLDSAKGGDMTAARIILDRIAPARRDNLVSFELPKIETAGDAAKASASVLKAVADGELTPVEAEAVAKIVETHLRALEASEFEARLLALESKGK
jgi:hypothetical protein